MSVKPDHAAVLHSLALPAVPQVVGHEHATLRSHGQQRHAILAQTIHLGG
jgi:hypothetical protein